MTDICQQVAALPAKHCGYRNGFVGDPVSAGFNAIDDLGMHIGSFDRDAKVGDQGGQLLTASDNQICMSVEQVKKLALQGHEACKHRGLFV